MCDDEDDNDDKEILKDDTNIVNYTTDGTLLIINFFLRFSNQLF